MPQLVALRFADPARMLDALDAVWAAGDAALPLDATTPPSVLEALVDRLRPTELRSEDGTTPTGHDVGVDRGTALVIATSGSTGARKGIALTHDALGASTTRSRTRLGAEDGTPWLGVLPLHHVAGISVALRSRDAGREPTLHRRATPGVLDAAEPCWISLVPTQLAALLDAGADLARHAGVLLGGAAAPADLLATVRARGVRVVTSYGATETCGGCVYDGRPLDDVEVLLDEEGRIGLRTPTVATGTRLPDGSVEPVVDGDGVWWTDDLGRLEAGVLHVTGRADDVVVSGGENVPLAPVRAALSTLPGLEDSHVVGLPHERWGTAVTAVVVTAPGADRPTLEGLRSALSSLLPPRHRPTGLVLAGTMPRDGLGKTTTAAVAAAIAAGTADHET